MHWSKVEGRGPGANPPIPPMRFHGTGGHGLVTTATAPDGRTLRVCGTRDSDRHALREAMRGWLLQEARYGLPHR